MVKNTTTTAIAKTPHKKLTKKQLGQLASFTDPGTVLAILAKEEWTIEESIQHLVKIAKGDIVGAKTSTQLAAIRYLNQLVVDTMERSGLMVIATKKYVGPDGTEVRFSGHVVSSVLGEQKEQTTPAELKRDIIEVEKSPKNGEKNGSESSENGADGEDESHKSGEEREHQTGLHTSKSPTGREAEGGHFDGISREGEGNVSGDNTADFI